MTTKLSPIGQVTLKENLGECDTWLDLGYGGEEGGVITFLCISELLYDEWEESQSSYIDWKQEFKLERVTKPGIYRDDELYDEHGSKKCFTIVVNYDFLTVKMVKDKIQELNKEYGTDFEIRERTSKTIELENGDEIELK